MCASRNLQPDHFASLHDRESEERTAELVRSNEALRGEIEARKCGEAMLVGENRVLEMVAKGESLPETLTAICRLIEATAEGTLCGIVLVDASGGRLEHGAGPSLPPGYNAAIHGRPVDACSGPCACAASLKEQVIAHDLVSDARWDSYGWRALALEYGLRACWSTPIFAPDGQATGVFAIYWREPCSPTAHHQQIIDQFTHLASVAIERKRTETALQESEERFRRMADTLPEVIWITSLEPETVVYVSPSFERIWGRSAAALYANPRVWTEAIHPVDRSRVAEEFGRWIAGEDVSFHDFEYRIVQPSGQVRWISDRGVLSFNEKGRPHRASGISTDITEQKLAQQALEKALSEVQALEHQFRLAVDTIPELVWTSQPDGNIEYLNQRWLEFTGLRLEEATGWGWQTAVHPDDLVGLMKYWRSLLASGLPGETEARLRRYDGEYRWFLFRGVPFYDEGHLVKWYGSNTEIEERKRAVEGLRASEQLARGQFEALTRTLDALARESNPECLVEHVLWTVKDQLDAHSCSAWKKDPVTGLIGFEFALENDRFVTKADKLLAAISPSAPVDAIWPWPEVFRTGKPNLLEDIRVGPLFPWREHLLAQGVISILIVPMAIAGKVEGVIGIRFTERRTFREEELELATALANQAMLAMQVTRLSAQSQQTAVTAERNRMAREIHDTLAQGFTGVIVQLEAAGDAKSRNLSKEVDEHLARAAELARESLREARRSVRALRPKALEEQELSVALRALLQRMTAGTRLSSEFILEGAERSLPATGDEDLLRIGQEALTNALRHSGATAFTITVVFGEDEVQMELRDNGCGFDVTREYEGFGLLGMKERARQMGGRLKVTSSAGAGATISVTAPLSKSAAIMP